jgi:hypothetical protein
MGSSRTLSPFTPTTTSPDSTPALSAGEPSMGAVTTTSSPLASSWTPMPT